MQARRVGGIVSQLQCYSSQLLCDYYVSMQAGIVGGIVSQLQCYSSQLLCDYYVSMQAGIVGGMIVLDLKTRHSVFFIFLIDLYFIHYFLSGVWWRAGAARFGAALATFFRSLINFFNFLEASGTSSSLPS